MKILTAFALAATVQAQQEQTIFELAGDQVKQKSSDFKPAPGMIFLNPLLGAAVGAGAGAISGKLADLGISDSFMKDLGDTLTPGTSALFVLVRKATPDKVLEGLKEFKGRVIQTFLTKDKEDELREVLEA